MDNLQHFFRTSQAYSYIAHMLTCLMIVATWWCSSEILHLPSGVILGILLLEAIIIPALIIWVLGNMFIQPFRVVWQAILYMAPDTSSVAAPDTKQVKYARELAENLVRQIYRLADAGQHLANTELDSNQSLGANFVANSLPLPLFILDKDDTVLFANHASADYLGKTAADIQNQSIHSVLNMSFVSTDTLDSWLTQTKQHTATATRTWQKVRLTLSADEAQAKYFDLAAYYNQGNPWGYETMLVLFDHTDEYSKQEQSMNYVALAVHELRTPLTMLRGYVEALAEDLQGKLTPELSGYLQKTEVAAGQLATFVNNILNVARIDDDQMQFMLHEERWQEVLPSILQDLSLRAQVNGITIKTDIAPDLPPVGIDRISMYEVVSNLIENAIKYSRGKSNEIIVSVKLQEGLIETTVQDFGVGIPESAIPKLFTKFYRDPHNRGHVTGTGLGLYICKTFIAAQGGNIWVRSKEGEGATFGFTLQPYSAVAESSKDSDNGEITRSAHGWIKNHSLYRR